MALRNRYGYNCQKIQWGKMQHVLPVGYVEVVPGETITGNVSVNCHSAPTVRNVKTRTFLDMFGYYIPFRLVHTDWPNFISGAASADPLPTVADPWTENFEPRITQAPVGSPAVSNLAFQRRAYNLVRQKFFSQVDDWDIGDIAITDNPGLATAFQRPSTFETAQPPKEVTEETIDTSGASLGVDDIRRAFSQDQFNKMRAFYGDRYVDFLQAIGVSASWSILDEPEVIGQKHTNWEFRQVNASATTPEPGTDEFLGESAGYFNSTVSLGMKRTFIPEHGLLAFYVVARADPVAEEPYAEPILNKSERDEFWSPEFETNKLKQWPNSLREGGNIQAPVNMQRPVFDEYRKGLNNNTREILTADTAEVMGMTVNKYGANYAAADFDDEFHLGITVPGNLHYQLTAEYRLKRQSPVSRHGQQRPIY